MDSDGVSASVDNGALIKAAHQRRCHIRIRKPSDALLSAATGGGARVVSSANRAAMRERLRSSIQVNGNVLFFYFIGESCWE